MRLLAFEAAGDEVQILQSDQRRAEGRAGQVGVVAWEGS